MVPAPPVTIASFDGGRLSLSAVALGSSGYIQQFVDLPQSLIVIILVVSLGAVAGWGILESVILACAFTLIEVGGLIAIVVVAMHADLPIATAITNAPPFALTVWAGIANGSLLAFSAFIGFEDLANVEEGATVPRRISHVPWSCPS